MPWDVETLKQHVDARFGDVEKAVSKAEDQLTKRFESVNEFRAMLEIWQRTQMPRTEAEKLIEGLTERVRQLEMTRMGVAGEQAGTKAGYIWAIGAVAVIATILGFFLQRGTP